MLLDVDKFITDNKLEFDEYERLYLKKIFDIPSLSAKETRDLFVKYRENNDMEAKRKIIEDNLKYLAIISKNYLNKGVDFWDLFNSGYDGLEKAVKKYIPNTKIAFRSYSYMWIGAHIEFAIPFNRTIRIPYSIYEYEHYFVNKLYEFENECDPKNVIKELANALHLSVEEVQKKLEIVKTSTSIEEPFLYDTYSFVDKSFENEILEKVDFDILKKDIERILTAEELDILNLRYDLDSDKCLTMKEIAKKYNSTRQNISLRLKGIFIKIQKELLNKKRLNSVEVLINEKLSKIKEEENYSLLVENYLDNVYLEYGDMGRKIMNLKINFPNLSLERIAYFTGVSEENVFYIMRKCATIMESSFAKNKTYKIN